MAVITLKCNNCGDNMHVDDSKQKAFCSSCGAENLITQDVVNIHNTTNYTVQQTIHKTIIGKEKTECEEFVANGNALLNLGEYAKAKEAFNNAVNANATDYRGWLGLATVDATTKEGECFELYQKALKVAIPEQREEVERAALLIAGETLIKYVGSSNEIAIPNSVTKIGESAFRGCTGLTSITIPNSVTTICDNAFMNCTSLTNITIPNSVTTICDNAFMNCTSLTNITIPNSVTVISKEVFSYCTSLTSITIPNSVTAILKETFWNCTSLTSITIPNSVTHIEEYAFARCKSVISITIPNSVIRVRKGAFTGWEKTQTIYVNKKNAKSWDKEWKYTYAKIKFI